MKIILAFTVILILAVIANLILVVLEWLFGTEIHFFRFK